MSWAPFVTPWWAEQVNAAAGIIQANVHADANIIVGALVDERCGKQVSVTVLATGFEVSRFASIPVLFFYLAMCLVLGACAFQRFPKQQAVFELYAKETNVKWPLVEIASMYAGKPF